MNLRAATPTFSHRCGSEKPKGNSVCFYNDLFRNRLQLCGEILWLLQQSYRQEEPTLDVALHGCLSGATVEVLILAFEWSCCQDRRQQLLASLALLNSYINQLCILHDFMLSTTEDNK